MPGLAAVAARFGRERPLAGVEVLMNMHLSAETARLGAALARGGAALAYLDSGRTPPAPGVVAAVSAQGARRLGRLDDLAAGAPLLVVEGNGRVFAALHGDGAPPDALRRVRGISEHTSGGGRLVDDFEAGGGRARVPVVAVYRSALKAVLETGLGTSQTAAAALLRGLRRPVAGRRVAVVGFGHVGRGVARLLTALGARLRVVERRAEAMQEAVLAGYELAALDSALATAEIVITATGRSGVVALPRLEAVREGQILANLSNRPDEIDLAGCLCESNGEGDAAAGHTLWRTPGGRRFSLLGGGVQLNHAIGRGNPAELMDLSFTLHALVLEWLARDPPAAGVHPPPPTLREDAARLCLPVP